MSILEIDLTPELENRLREEAKRQGLSSSEYALSALERMSLPDAESGVKAVSNLATDQDKVGHNIMELHGLGAEIWKNEQGAFIDAQDYVNELRQDMMREFSMGLRSRVRQAATRQGQTPPQYIREAIEKALLNEEEDISRTVRFQHDWKPFQNLEGLVRLIVLVDWDPIGVLWQGLENMDEYDDWIRGIFEFVKSGASQEAITDYLLRFDLRGKGVPERAVMAASKLFKAGQVYREEKPL